MRKMASEKMSAAMSLEARGVGGAEFVFSAPPHVSLARGEDEDDEESRFAPVAMDDLRWVLKTCSRAT